MSQVRVKRAAVATLVVAAVLTEALVVLVAGAGKELAALLLVEAGQVQLFRKI